MANGQLKVEQDISILPPGMSKIGLVPPIFLSPDGKFLYAGLADTVRFSRISRYRVLEDGRPSFLASPKPTKSPGD